MLSGVTGGESATPIKRRRAHQQETHMIRSTANAVRNNPVAFLLGIVIVSAVMAAGLKARGVL